MFFYFKGSDLIENSSRRFEVSLDQDGRKQTVILFVFDHQLIVCRNDEKRSRLIYLSRIDLDRAQIEHVNETFSWRLHDRLTNKTYLFTHQTSLEKQRILDLFAYVDENRSKKYDLPFLTRLFTEQTLSKSLSSPSSGELIK